MWRRRMRTATSARTRPPSSTAHAWRRSSRIRSSGSAATNVIAFVAETVGGATSGALTPPPGYFRRIREICDHHGILLILDEVMCGMGRTGTLHACEQEGVAPDLMAIAKGLGGGYQPVGAVLIGQRIIDAIAAGSGILPAWPHLHRPPGGVRGGARRAAGAGARPSGGALRDPGPASARGARRSVPRAPVCRRRARARPLPGDRTRGRPRHQGAVRPATASSMPGSRGPRWNWA